MLKMAAKLLRCFKPTLSASEHTQLIAHFSHLKNADQQLVFYKLWTLAEALTKFYGWTLWQFFQRRIPCTFSDLEPLLSTNTIQLNSLTVQYFMRHNRLHCLVSTAAVEAEWVDHITSA
jgi:phosphopantetheinyl transferase